MSYKYNTDRITKEFLENGFSYLPSIKNLIDKEDIAKQIIFESGKNNKTYIENSKIHIDLVKLMDLEKLFVSIFNSLVDRGHKIKLEDRYFITRIVRPGQNQEGFRGHFDGHLVTIVLPILMPHDSSLDCGELYAFPNARKHPKNEIINFLQKIYWKKYANKSGFDKLNQNNKVIVDFFDDFRPLIFNGIRTFHGNNFLSNKLGTRISLLCHLYDPSSKYGISAALRKIRNR